MRNLFRFLYRIRIFVLFVLLEIIAFVWIHNSRSYQRAVFHNSANELSGSLLEKTNELDELFDLYEQNERLARENARLKSLLKDSYFPLTSSDSTHIDSLYRVRYSYLSGEVINLSYRKARNYMLINRGKVHGIESGMGVSSSEGVVGIVNDVSRHFATVIPLINPGFSVSGKIKGTGFFGPVKWNTNDYRYASLTDIPRYASFEPGDTIITDARSQVFPAGIAIGYVESAEMQDDQNFYEVRIRLAVDFASLNHIYIITDKMKKEARRLQQSTQP